MIDVRFTPLTAWPHGTTHKRRSASAAAASSTPDSAQHSRPEAHMAKAGTVHVTIEVDMRPALYELGEAADILTVRAGATRSERDAAIERMHSRQLAGAAEVFEGARWMRARFDPRRLIDRWHERACRRTAAAFEGALEATTT